MRLLTLCLVWGHNGSTFRDPPGGAGGTLAEGGLHPHQLHEQVSYPLRSLSPALAKHLCRASVRARGAGVTAYGLALYLVMTLACVRLSILLASNRAWPHKAFFMADSSASCGRRASTSVTALEKQGCP